MITSRSERKKRLKLAAICVAVVSVCLYLLPDPAPSVHGATNYISANPTPTPARRMQPLRNPEARKPKYSEFSHSVKAHNIACSSCHTFPSKNWKTVRDADAAYPDITEYPNHASCINCHRQQFFRGATPAICTICHTSPSPRNSTRHPFPNPRERFDASPKGRTADSDFQAFFPHEVHTGIVSELISGEGGIVNASWRGPRMQEESCAVCHQTMTPQCDGDEEFLLPPPARHGDAFWLKRGTFKSSPIGHTTCFTCHSTETGISPAPTDCATCHKLKEAIPISDFDPVLAQKIGVKERVVLDAWRTRASSATFRHEFSSHAEMSCSTCHNVEAMITTDFRTKRVPVASCSNCHITASSDDGGVLNYEIDERKTNPTFQCVKCHLAFGDKPIPKSHFEAVAAMAGN
ncbi:hypothetical protein BH24ACI3_BH24ACI3_08570 [soil metagenome]